MTRPIVAILGAAPLWGVALGCSSSVEPGSPTCNAYLDEAPQQEVTITIRNDTAETLYLSGPGCSSAIQLSLSGPDGAALPLQPSGCGFTCGDLQKHGPECPAICAAPPVVRVEPQGSYQASWSGTHVEPRTMPEGCFFEPEYTGDGACGQRVVAAAADYSITAHAWPEMSCQVDTCDCQPDANGSCVVQGFASVGGSEVRASSSVSYPDESTMEIVFQ